MLCSTTVSSCCCKRIDWSMEVALYIGGVKLTESLAGFTHFLIRDASVDRAVGRVGC